MLVSRARGIRRTMVDGVYWYFCAMTASQPERVLGNFWQSRAMHLLRSCCMLYLVVIRRIPDRNVRRVVRSALGGRLSKWLKMGQRQGWRMGVGGTYNESYIAFNVSVKSEASSWSSSVGQPSMSGMPLGWGTSHMPAKTSECRDKTD